ncbi:MAG TPA: arsenate reductase (glutaredoxin) [Noviherbaspirillum sp.]|uniref:arsenate reductase (glutaredoxin) n=1 Tax=Noviherbaspirillum sp. TaxID=1926288 RepID=UPI002F94FEAE
MLKIYHNPRCSKSRGALALVEQFGRQQGIPVDVIEYLKQPPTEADLQELQRMLRIDARAMVRDGEAKYADLKLEDADDATLLSALARHPELLQRPLVVYRGRAIIARPPELLEEFLQA